jgi:hypothetical protein
VLTQPRFELQVDSLSPVLGSAVRISRERARVIVQQHLQSQIVAAVGNENHWYLAFSGRIRLAPGLLHEKHGEILIKTEKVVANILS